MPIPEYTNRVIADAANSRGVNIQEPNAFTEAQRTAQQQGAQFRRGLGQLAGVYLDMKQERDEGIVNQFMNEFDMAKTLKIQELKEQYNGGNAEGIIAAYNDWQREYLNSRKGRREDSNDNTLYLENDEQIAAVDKAFGQDLAKSVNTMSAYVAGELKDFKDKQYAARDEMLLDELAGEVDLNNMAITENMLRDNLMRRYPNQSQEFYDSQMKKKMKSAISANVSNDLLTQPEYALEKLTNPYIQEKLGEDETNDLTLKAGRAYVDREIDRISSEKAVGNNAVDNIEGWDNKGFTRYRKSVGDNNIKKYVDDRVKQQTNIKQDNLRRKIAERRKKDLSKLISEINKSQIADQKEKDKLHKKFQNVLDYIDKDTAKQAEREQRQLQIEARAQQREKDRRGDRFRKLMWQLDKEGYKQAERERKAAEKETTQQVEKVKEPTAADIALQELFSSFQTEGETIDAAVLKNAHDVSPEETQFIIDTYSQAKYWDSLEEKGTLVPLTVQQRAEVYSMPDTDERKKQLLEVDKATAAEKKYREDAAVTLQSLASGLYDNDFDSLYAEIKGLPPRLARDILNSWNTNYQWKMFTQYAAADKRVPDNIDRIMSSTLNQGQKNKLADNPFILNAMQEQAQYDVLKYIQGHPNEIMTTQVLSNIMNGSKQVVLHENKEIIELDNMLGMARSKIARSRGREASYYPPFIAEELLKQLEGNEKFSQLRGETLDKMVNYLMDGDSIMAQQLWNSTKNLAMRNFINERKEVSKQMNEYYEEQAKKKKERSIWDIFW